LSGCGECTGTGRWTGSGLRGKWDDGGFWATGGALVPATAWFRVGWGGSYSLRIRRLRCQILVKYHIVKLLVELCLVRC
jgi:hypothetical protein